MIPKTIRLPQTDKNRNRFLEKIQMIPEVMECHRTSGQFDYILQIISGGLNSFENLLHDHFDKMSEIQQMEAHIILKTEKKSHTLPLRYPK